MKKYEPQKIEPKWQKIWAEAKLDRADDANKAPKSYVLPFFPYPSGEGLHVGHVRNYTITDILARHRRMNGFSVLHAIGWDAFGLPAENYAIKTGVSPQVATRKNTDNFRRQMKSLGLSFDWDREVDSSDPGYYKWTQWIFLKLFERGLAYQNESEQFWCEHDKTVLANEQVENGRCWRCGNVVTKKRLKQWFFKITAYADELLSDLDTLDWPESIKLMQRNWIGRSVGAEIEFAIDQHKVTVFTTRADTLAGATFLVLAPEHPLVNEITTPVQRQAVEKYLSEVKTETEVQRQDTARPKTGVFTGAYTKNPITGDKMPVWAADYVLMGYGTGAIMAVPAHDERDFEFAQQFDLPVKQVVEPTYVQSTEPGKVKEGEPFDHREAIIAIVKHWSEDKYVALKWKQVAWGTFITGGIEAGQTPAEAAKAELEQEVGYTDAKFIRDYGVVHGKFYHVPKKLNRNAHAHVVYLELQSDAVKPVAVEEAAIHEVRWLAADELKKFLTPDTHQHALRWLLGEQEIYTGYGTLANSGEFDRLESAEAKTAIIEHLQKVGMAKPALNYKLRDWLISRQRYWGAPIPVIHCAKCGVVPVPAGDLPVELPEIADYLPTGDGRSPLAKAKDWVEVSCPKCDGPAERETDTMDTFACSSWYFLRFADPKNSEVFADQTLIKQWLPVDFYVGGAEHAVLHLLYARFWTKALRDASVLEFGEPFTALRNQGMISGPDGHRMSKSRGNVINPDHVVDRYGADSLRVYEMFMGPYDQEVAWSEERLAGVWRFLVRVWSLVMALSGEAEMKTAQGADRIEPAIFATEVDRMANKTIKKVAEDLTAMRFNTMISALMEYTNFLGDSKRLSNFGLGDHEELAQRTARTLVLLLAPVAPHLAEELWVHLGETESVHRQAWPKYDAALTVDELVEVAVQINGKLRGTVTVAREDAFDPAKLEQAARGAVADRLTGTVKKVITVPGKLVNFVIG